MENYGRKGTGIRWMGALEPSDDTPCNCDLCIDPETKRWQDDVFFKQSNCSRSDNDMLLTPRLLGFSLGRKEWCQFWLSNITINQHISTETDEPGVEGIVLPETLSDEEKTDIYNMVLHHWDILARPRKKRVGDAIGGKGESLVLLFHGKLVSFLVRHPMFALCLRRMFVCSFDISCSLIQPGHSGTGKTLYAESLAKYSRRPLYKVGTSDIGLDPAKAERNLKDVFELAEAWSAILLM